MYSINGKNVAYLDNLISNFIIKNYKLVEVHKYTDC